MNDDDKLREMAEQHNDEANRSLTFCGVLIIAAVAAFVACSLVAILRALGG